MKIFISWSGDLSREVAELVSKSLRPILWDAIPFMSKEDIPSGAEWARILAAELKESLFAIVCLTPQNLNSPWLLYEAGALTNHPDKRLCALLLGGLTPADVPSPLERYQHRAFSEPEFKALMEDIRGTLENPPKEEEFTRNFSRLWPEIWENYQRILKRVPASPRPRTVVTTFERTVLRLPLSEQLLAELGDFVEDTRQKCLAQIRRVANQPQLSSDCVRANVFVPDYIDPRRGYAFELSMHERLRRQMNRPQEWPIRFAPGQGATGTVFVECQQRIVDRRDFELTEELRDAIDPELRWIISSPIRGSSGAALAVLNIDGLKYDLDKEAVLRPVGEGISEALKRLQVSLDGYPKTIVTVQYGELQ